MVAVRPPDTPTAERGRAVLLAGCVEDRRRQIDLDGSRPAVPQLAEREAQHLRSPRPLEDRTAPLDRRAEQLELILALEGRGPRRLNKRESKL
jgi:hypothetical protein